MKHEISEWAVAADVWHEFCQVHQELGLKSGRMQFHNFLRRYREPLLQADAMRRANNRHWICHRSRFIGLAFDLATRCSSGPQGEGV